MAYLFSESLIGLGLIDWTRLAGQQAPRIYPSLPPQCRNIQPCTSDTVPGFYIDSGNGTQVLRLVQEAGYQLIYPPGALVFIGVSKEATVELG